MTLIYFQHCLLEINHEDRYTQTVFEDGASAVGRPNNREEDVQRAYHLGYGGDTWQMTMEHEAYHTRVPEMMGKPYSLVLWHQAHDDGKPWPRGTRDEEGYVTSVQWHLHHGSEDEVLRNMFEGFIMRAQAHMGWSRVTILDEMRLLLGRVSRY